MPAAHVEGLYSCLDYYQNVSDPFSKNLINRYNKLYPGDAKFTAGSACSGLYRGLRLWEAAVKEAGSLKQDDVIKALDHAKIAEGPGGPAEMVPGQHHVRMNMYIAQASNGCLQDRQEPRRHRSEGSQRASGTARVGTSDLTWDGVLPRSGQDPDRGAAHRAKPTDEGFDQCCRKPKAPAS